MPVGQDVVAEGTAEGAACELNGFTIFDGSESLRAMAAKKALLSGGEGEAEGSPVAVSGKGYSNRVLSVANGVPTIWDDGECKMRSVRSERPGIARRMGDLRDGGNFGEVENSEGSVDALGANWAGARASTACGLKKSLSDWEVVVGGESG